MKTRIVSCLLFAALIPQLHAISRAWTNSLGGDWFVGANWSPNGVPTTADVLWITNDGTYTVTILTNSVTAGTITIGGGSGTQTLLNGTINVLTTTNFADLRNNGVLIVTNGGILGNYLIEAGGQAQFSNPSGLFLYNSSITNFGTVTWTGGSLAVGGNNSQTTFITNAGLWQMTGNDSMNYGGGSRPVFYNSGTLRKLNGTGTSQLFMDLINLPSGVVDVQSGTFRIAGYQTNFLGGTFSIAASATITLSGSSYTDTGGISTGSGTFQFTGGSFYLRTNSIPGVKFIGGDVYINNNTFQSSGAITNLTLDGVALHGTNRVSGTLTFNSGNLLDSITVQPSGQLVLATAGSKLLYSLNLVNQGIVNWTGGGLAVGGTPPTVISNGGSWLMSSDDSLNYGGGPAPTFINSGTIRKNSGSPPAASSFSGFSFPNAFVNQSNGLIQVDAGFITLPSSYTNTAGELRLNGGGFQGSGFTLNGGVLDGTGTVVQNSLIGGTISPGQSGAGLISFSQGLNLDSNATLVIDGTGTTAGSQYDQLSVTGAASIANCNLQIASLPSVPLGTAFIIINNDGADPVAGTFNGLPENTVLTVSGQLFRIHYAGGTGNDVVLVRDTGATAPVLAVGGGSYTNGSFRLTGFGGSLIAYGVQATTNFITWTNIGSATGDLGGNFIFTDTNAAKFHYRFYRTTN